MNVGDLKSIFASLSETLRAAGANAAAQDLNQIRKAFPENSDENALEALEAIESALNHERMQLRSAYLSDLKRAATNKGLFNEAFDRLTLDKLMDKDDVAMIATEYIGAGRKWRSKAAAMQSIQEKFNERAYLESKMRLLEKSTIG